MPNSVEDVINTPIQTAEAPRSPQINRNIIHKVFRDAQLIFVSIGPRMNRKLWLIPIAALILWLALKDIVYRSVIAGDTQPETAPATYLDEDGWALLPVEPPPGAWTAPWGIDLFVIPPPTAIAIGSATAGAANPDVVSDMTRNSESIEKALAPAGPSFSPVYRHPSAAFAAAPDDWDIAREDIAMAFERYLYTKNNWRGVLIVASPETQQLLSPLLQRIEADPALLQRFSGVVLLGGGNIPEASEIKCSPAMDGNCVLRADVKRKRSMLRWILPQLHRSPVRFVITDEAILGQSLADRNTRLSLWLDKNAPKPAEPLGGIDDMEVIEIAPIRRPGETDEALAEQELRKN